MSGLEVYLVRFLSGASTALMGVACIVGALHHLDTVGRDGLEWYNVAAALVFMALGCLLVFVGGLAVAGRLP